ncbi:MAG TPA: DinB family protein [Tepidisphaeraceae bacterium]|jgi:uncharacterized damage-inducible protein DinB|nr:DinB family protein [Tepidisphaeraceae bacterium]
MTSIARMFIDDQRSRFADSRQRLDGIINQLSDEDLNWRPNPQSNSITNLILHICGSLTERYAHNIAGQPNTRNRTSEFDTTAQRAKSDLLQMIDDAFHIVDAVLTQMPHTTLFDTTQIRGRDRSILDLIATTSAHTAEHLGQIIYIAKIRLGPKYQYLLKV